MNKKLTVITSVLLLLALPINALAEGNYYNDNSKEVNFTNKKGEESFKEELKSIIHETNYWNYEKFGFGIKGGELDLIFERIGKIEVGPSISTTSDYRHPVKITDKMIVSDLRGTGEGWNLSISATPLTSYIDGKEFSKLPSGTFTLKGTPTVKAMNNLNKGLPSTEFYARESEVAIDDGKVVLVSAYYDEGFGNWEIDTSTLELYINIKRDTLIRTSSKAIPTPYTTKITWSLTSGPGI